MCPILKTCFESTRPPQNPSKYQNIPDPRILSSPHYSLSCRQKGSGSRLRLHFGFRRHLALLVHYSVLDRASSTPHAPGGGARALSCARYSYVTATPRTDPAPACRPELTCGPQCEAARGYVKVLALHSACASGAHARARGAHIHGVPVPVRAELLSIEFGHLSAQNRHIFRSAGLKRALARLRLARFLTRQNTKRAKSRTIGSP